MNDVLSSSEHTQVDEDDSDEINIQDCDGDKDGSIDEEYEKFWLIYTTWMCNAMK